MWYTLVVLLGAALLYWITDALVPNAFPDAVRTTCRILLVVLYYQWSSVPHWMIRRFRCARLWEWIRHVQFGGAPIIDSPNVEPKTQYIYAVVPHGVYAEGAIMGMVLRDRFESATIVCSSLLFWLPIVREFAMMVGAIHADAVSIIKALDEGNSLILLPEGMRGSLHVDTPLDVLRGAPHVGCKPRTGWIQCAANSVNRDNIRIVPVYIDGTADMYWRWNNNITWNWLQQLLLRHIHYPWPMVHAGMYGTFWPRSVPLRVVCGVPIALPPISIGPRAIKMVQDTYCDAIRDLMKLYE